MSLEVGIYGTEKSGAHTISPVVWLERLVRLHHHPSLTQRVYIRAGRKIIEAPGRSHAYARIHAHIYTRNIHIYVLAPLADIYARGTS